MTSPYLSNFQVIAGRGKGKSTMIRHLLKTSDHTDIQDKDLPNIGSNETTREPTSYKLRNEVKKHTVYLWDMPGLDGKI